VLKNFPYEFQCRGKVKVKGKGDMTTYFLTDRKQPGTVRVDDLPGMRNAANTGGGKSCHKPHNSRGLISILECFVSSIVIA
jgi:hypothetical protein